MKGMSSMKVSNETIKNVNLHIEKAPDNVSHTARLCAENGDVLAATNFQYEPDVSILARLEDNAGKNIRVNADLIRKFGSNLFNNVFSGAILARYQSLRRSRTRLKLIFEKHTPDLLRIPWEFMFDGKHFLSASPKMTMTRVLKRTSSAISAIKEEVARKLKTLAVVPAPVDLPEFYRPQAEKEHAIIREFMGCPEISDKMELDFLKRSTLENLKQKLDEEEHHVLLFTTHGIYSQTGHMCYVLFEDEFGNSKRADSETMADILAGHRSLRLVMLSCCRTVLAVGHRVLGELPVALLSKGVPAVIVMQYSVTDQSAVKLSGQLLRGICQGMSLDRALANARRTLLLAGHEGLVDFGSPILYSEHPEAFFPSSSARSKS
jgi:CHAT domain-containing protein